VLFRGIIVFFYLKIHTNCRYTASAEHTTAGTGTEQSRNRPNCI